MTCHLNSYSHRFFPVVGGYSFFLALDLCVFAFSCHNLETTSILLLTKRSWASSAINRRNKNKKITISHSSGVSSSPSLSNVSSERNFLLLRATGKAAVLSVLRGTSSSMSRMVSGFLEANCPVTVANHRRVGFRYFFRLVMSSSLAPSIEDDSSNASLFGCA